MFNFVIYEYKSSVFAKNVIKIPILSLVRNRYLKPKKFNPKQAYGLGRYTWDRSSTYNIHPDVLQARKNKLLSNVQNHNDEFCNPLGMFNSMSVIQNKGAIYDKKPFKYHCIKGKIYDWCNCGYSRSQPFCDCTHKNKRYNITLKPIRFMAPETKDYWFCNCKQSNKRPFCDGTHRKDFVQNAVSIINY